MATQGEITDLVAGLATGDRGAAERLTPIVHDALHEIAEVLMRRERGDHTLQPTALVNEAYLRLVDQKRVDWKGRTHFLAVAAESMRRVLVDHARARGRQKRQGDRQRVTLDTDLSRESGPVDILEIDDLLGALQKLDPQQHRIAELRLFAGLDTKEIALALGVTEPVVRRDWRMARKWLEGRLEGGNR